MIKLKTIDELKPMPSRWRVTAYLPEDMQKAIEGWAAEENRSVSNLAATILINAIKEYERSRKKILPNDQESR
jgi:plasmid stability protein